MTEKPKELCFVYVGHSKMRAVVVEKTVMQITIKIAGKTFIVPPSKKFKISGQSAELELL